MTEPSLEHAIRLPAELDLAASDEIERAVGETPANDTVVLDFTEVLSCRAFVLGRLLVRLALRHRRGEIRLVNLHEQQRRFLSALGLPESISAADGSGSALVLHRAA